MKNKKTKKYYAVSGVMPLMASMLTLTAVDHVFEPDRVKPKTMKLVFVASPLSMQH